MRCPRCGAENPEGARSCASCGAELVASAERSIGGAAYPPAPPPRTSGLAIASLVLGLLGILTFGVTSLVGIVLGIVSLIQIQRRPDRLTGTGFAIGGLAISALTFMVLPIFAAILFPVFAQAREKAVQASCMANLKQLQLSTLMYAKDHDDHLPMRDKWCDQTLRYVRNEAVYVCPSLPDERCGYAYNARLDRLTLDDLREPARTVGLFDAKGGWNAAGGAELVDPRHNGGANVTYVDGHVKWTSERGLDALGWDPLASGGRQTGPSP